MHGFVVAVTPTEGIDQLHRRTDATEWIELEDLDVFDGLDAGVGVFVQQAFQHLPGCALIFGKVVALAHLVGALATRQRRLVEGDVADQVERIELLAEFLLNLVGQRLPQHALPGQLLDDGLLLRSIAPASQERIQRGELQPDLVARVVAQGLGDELAVRAVVLHALGDHRDGDVVDHVARARLAYASATRRLRLAPGWFTFAVTFVRAGRLLRWHRRLAGIGLIDLHRIAIEGRIGEQLGGFLEIHDGEPVLVVVLVDTRTAADDLLELGHRLDVLVENDQLAGLRIHAGGHQLAGGGDDRVALFRIDEVVQLGLALVLVTGDAHDVLAALTYAFRVEVDQGLPHTLGVVDVVAEHDGLLVRISGHEEFGDLLRYQLGARFKHQ